MSTLTVYAYPWDLLDDPAVFERATRIGARRIAIAAVYHGVRAETPQHPNRAIVDAPVSMDLVGSGLTAGGMTIAAGPADATFERAAAACREAGFEVSAWTVLNHLDGVDTSGACVINAFGEEYRYALCPRSERTRAFALAAVGRAARAADIVTLEAAGQLGAEHAGCHDKSGAGSWSPWQRQALSWCFCDRCQEALVGYGYDPEALARGIREGLRGGDIPDPETADVLDRLRTEAGSAMLLEIVAAARNLGVEWIAVHGAPGAPTGPATALDRSDVNEWIIPAWDDADSAVPRLREARDLAGDKTLGTYMTILDPEVSIHTLRDRIDAVLAEGADNIHLYHLGLATSALWDVATAALVGSRWGKESAGENERTIRS